MSDKKTPANTAKAASPKRGTAEPASAANMTEKAAKPAPAGKKSSAAPTTPPAGSGATSAAADAASTSTATKSSGRGNRTASADRSTAGTRTSKRESLRKTPESPVTNTPSEADDREERIRRRAYELWEGEGWPHGREQEHWAQAEREMMGLGGASISNVGPGEDRAGVVALPAAGGQPGASEALDGTPSALRTAGRSRRGKA